MGACVSDEQQYSISAFFMRAGGWRIFNNRTAAYTRWKIAGAVELGWLAENDKGVRMWDLKGTSKIISTAAAGRHRFPVTGIG